MSEYEMAALHADLFNSIQATLTVYITVLSGFLVMSYLVAHRLTRVMTVIALSVYAGFSLIVIFGAHRVFLSFAGLSREMHAMAEAGKGLGWHSTSSLLPAVPEVLPVLFLAAGILVTTGSLVFFFNARRANRKAEAHTPVA